jgi:hypothetical protein
MKQKLLLLTFVFLLLGSVSFHKSIACDPKPKKTTGKSQPAATEKKIAKSKSIPFDLYPFVQTLLLN